jgi:hypothetical protein
VSQVAQPVGRFLVGGDGFHGGRNLSGCVAACFDKPEDSRRRPRD